MEHLAAATNQIPDRGPGARVVVVTGASSGIGRAVADTLHGQGWVVIGASRRPAAGVPWRHEQLDVTDETSVARLVDGVADTHGRLDALVCCAGSGVAGPAEFESSDARHQFETNFWGTVNAVRPALAHLRATGGRVVVVSSVAGMLGIPFQAMYAASKFALEGWVESLWWETAPLGVSVTLVQPGNFHTGFTDARRTSDAAGPYEEACRRAVAKMEADERAGGDPHAVARVVAKVLEQRRPPLRVSVGSLEERSGVWAKKLLPFGLFARLARRSLNG